MPVSLSPQHQARAAQTTNELAVVQYVDLNHNYRNRLAILLTLANNCELQPFERDASLPHQAA